MFCLLMRREEIQVRVQANNDDTRRECCFLPLSPISDPRLFLIPALLRLDRLDTAIDLLAI